jgi:APA family basic amino acid/polyamine antiporter
MSKSTKGISPQIAILICINSIIGAGLFINPQVLTQLAGPYGFASYALGTLVLLPIILCVAELAKLHPVAGGLYAYSKAHIGPWAGFLSAWAYFLGKSVSAAVLIHKVAQFFQARIDLLASIPLFALDISLIAFFVTLNSCGVSIGGRIQYLFSLLKAIPILATFCMGFFLFDARNFVEIVALQELFLSLPTAIFALLGFEVICAIGNQIHDAKNNIKRVIITSFLIVAAINITFQALIFASVGYDLTGSSEPLLALCLKAFASSPFIGSLLNGVVFASIIGGFFSVITSNCWNLYTLALNNHLPGKRLLTKLNKHNVPWVSLCLEAMLACAILLITVNQQPLQNMAVGAQILSFFMTTTACFYAVARKEILKLSIAVPIAGLLSCSCIFGIASYRVFSFGISFSFVSIFLIGCTAALAQHCITRRQRL